MLPDKIEKRIDELVKSYKDRHYAEPDLMAGSYKVGATTISTELYEHIKELRGALDLIINPETNADWDGDQIRNTLQSSIEKWGE